MPTCQNCAAASLDVASICTECATASVLGVPLNLPSLLIAGMLAAGTSLLVFSMLCRSRRWGLASRLAMA